MTLSNSSDEEQNPDSSYKGYAGWAYGMVLSSNYNLRPKPAEILINKNLAKIITRRQKLNNII